MEKNEEKKKKALEEEMLDEVNGGGELPYPRNIKF